MKFLVFNFVVTLALVCLFIAEKPMSHLDTILEEAQAVGKKTTSAITNAIGSKRIQPVEQPHKPQKVTHDEVMPKAAPVTNINTTPTSIPLKTQATALADVEPISYSPAEDGRAVDAPLSIEPLGHPKTIEMHRAKPVPKTTVPQDSFLNPSSKNGGPDTQTASTTKFMTPVERKRELTKLARSAEDMFINRISK